MSIYWLGSTQAHDARQVGGKAAQLSRLAAEHAVPAGFCLPAQPAGASLGLSQQQEIAAAYARLGQSCGQANPPVAVRSSGIDEDGFQASFAGQHDTYLNVRGLPAVIACVQRCLESAAGPRVLAYRQAIAQRSGAGNRLAGAWAFPERREGPPAIAVLVQQLIQADVSAVAFSADPASGQSGRILINATWGLGEGLVSGLVTPDLYVVPKSGLAGSLAPVHTQIACKDSMTICGLEETRQVPVPRALQNEPALQPAQVRLVARLALSLEQRQGWPVDIECAFQGQRLFLLQCRPITTLADSRLTSPHLQAVPIQAALPVQAG